MDENIPVRSLKEKQRQEREELILQVTEDVLLEKGFHDTAMEEIAARVGIAKGTLYLHFARKEDLMIALLEREQLHILHMVEENYAKAGTAQERLASIMRSLYLGWFGKRGRLFYLFFNTEGLGSMMQEKHSCIMQKISLYVTELHEEGQKRGEFDPQLPADVMLSTFFSVLSPRIYKRMVLDKQMSPEALVFYVERIYFRGIANDTHQLDH